VKCPAHKFDQIAPLILLKKVVLFELKNVIVICPYCNNKNTKVVDKRDNENEPVSRRRRECLLCKKRFTTYERIEILFFKIRKKDGSLENYDKGKLVKGIKVTLEKRGIDEVKVEALINDVESHIFARKSDEISSSDIGRLVLTRLKKLDKVAYLRFASVFLDFENEKDFKKEIDKLIN